jgi:hypothetical protein
MKVYIATKGWDYEGFSIEGVYLSEESAKAKIEELRRLRIEREPGNGYDTDDILEIEVQP